MRWPWLRMVTADLAVPPATRGTRGKGVDLPLNFTLNPYLCKSSKIYLIFFFEAELNLIGSENSRFPNFNVTVLFGVALRCWWWRLTRRMEVMAAKTITALMHLVIHSLSVYASLQSEQQHQFQVAVWTWSATHRFEKRHVSVPVLR